MGLIDVARRYHERGQSRIPVGDVPDWIYSYLPPSAKEVENRISELAMQKSEFDLLAYSLYGSGDALGESVCSLLTQIGLQVERQSTGANIDLKAKHHALSLGFAIEVTGTKGTIQKDSNKIAQAWQYLKDREGTSEEDDRLMIVANTEIHLVTCPRSLYHLLC